MYVINGKRTELGLGSVASIPLATARRLAGEMREAVAVGTDPKNVLAPLTPPEAKKLTTFADFTDTYISSVEAGWKNEVHRKQWRTSLRDHAASLSDLPIDAIDTDAVMTALQPIWLTKAETAKRCD